MIMKIERQFKHLQEAIEVLSITDSEDFNEYFGLDDEKWENSLGFTVTIKGSGVISTDGFESVMLTIEY